MQPRLRILYHGALWYGSTARQRAEALARRGDVEAFTYDTGPYIANRHPLWTSLRARARYPVDCFDENRGLVLATQRHDPDVVIVDSSKVLRSETLRDICTARPRLLVYYTPDDIIGRHNLTWQLRRTFRMWDVFLTTKTFNVPELRDRGVRFPILIGNSFDANIHRPLSESAVGPEFERFDLVFVGAYEAERRRTVNALAAEGYSVVVHGSSSTGWSKAKLHPAIVLRPVVLGDEYTRAMHTGKIALSFLRKLNRDLITTRTIEVPAMERVMLSERSSEVDSHFVEGLEYEGFTTAAEAVAKVKVLLRDRSRRQAVAAQGRQRCLTSGYSTDERALEMVRHFHAALCNI